MEEKRLAEDQRRETRTERLEEELGGRKRVRQEDAGSRKAAGTGWRHEGREERKKGEIAEGKCEHLFAGFNQSHHAG